MIGYVSYESYDTKGESIKNVTTPIQPRRNQKADTLSRNQRNKRNQRNFKGKCFLDKIDNIVYSTNDYTLWNFYRNLFYGKPFPGDISNYVPGPTTDWNVITHNDRVLMRKINGKYVEVD